MEKIENLPEICCKPNYFVRTFKNWTVIGIITVISVIFTIYLTIIKGREYILNNWTVYRNNPLIIPFAGIIKGDEKASLTNFSEYVLTIIGEVIKLMLKPVLYIFRIIIQVIKNVVKTLNNFRNFFYKLRLNVLNYFDSLQKRLSDVMGTMQYTLLKFFNILGKASGMLTISKYLLLTVAFTLKTIVSVIGEIVKTLIIIALSILGVLMLVGGPFIWGVLGSLYWFCAQLNISSCCFDEDTPIKLDNGKYLKIKEISHSDILFNNTKVIGIIKSLPTKNNMYNYKNIIVTGDHTVFEENKWIRVSNSKNSKKINNYQKKYIYCLITDNNTIPINEYLFGDYCEINDKKDIIKINNYSLHCLNNFKHKKLSSYSNFYDGFTGNTQIRMEDGTFKKIKDIQILDQIKNGFITALVKIYIKEDYLFFYNNDCMTGGVPTFVDSKWIRVCDTKSKRKKIKNFYVYHICTSNGIIETNNQNFFTDFSELKNEDVLEKIDNFVLKKKNKFNNA